MLVREFMIYNVIKVKPETSVKEVLKILVDKEIGGMPICDDHDALLGMVSDGDILRTIKPIESQIYGLGLYMEYLAEHNLQTRIKEIADVEIIKIAKIKGLITVYPDDEIDYAVKLLSKHHFKKLPVVNRNNRVIGVISRGDVLRKIQASILNNI
jgi:CBS domain-containing protein